MTGKEIDKLFEKMSKGTAEKFTGTHPPIPNKKKPTKKGGK